MCSTGIGHADCFTQFTEVVRVGHKADRDSYTRAKKHALRNKIRQQLINKQENKQYYQNSTEWHSPSTEQEILKRRKLTE